LAVAGALAPESRLLSGERRALRVPRPQRCERVAVPRRDGGAGRAGLPLVAVAVHERTQAQGLSLELRTGVDPRSALGRLEGQIAECRRCPRLVEWREKVAREKRAAFADEKYWGRPVPGFGDPEARIYIL